MRDYIFGASILFVFMAPAHILWSTLLKTDGEKGFDYVGVELSNVVQFFSRLINVNTKIFAFMQT